MNWTARPLEAGELEEFVYLNGRVFGIGYQPEDIEHIATRLIPERIRVVAERGRIIGGGGVYPFDLTLPGGATVPVAGITFISVDATHRRSGVQRAVMAALHEDSVERGEPAQILTASEGGIYGRFGYGVATQRRGVTIERQLGTIRSDAPRGGRVAVLDDLNQVYAAYRRCWAQHCRSQPGAVSLTDSWWTFLLGPIGDKVFGGTRHHIVHFDEHETVDGIASYRLEPQEDEFGPNGTAHLFKLLADDPVAHAELWRAVLGVDRASRIEISNMAIDDPLPFLLENARAVRTTSLRDDLWVRPADISRLLAARTYERAGTLALDVDGQTFHLDVDENGRATCKPAPSTNDVDLTIPSSSLGAALVGAPVLLGLAAAQRIRPSSPEALTRADAMFRTARLPWMGQAF